MFVCVFAKIKRNNIDLKTRTNINLSDHFVNITRVVPLETVNTLLYVY